MWKILVFFSFFAFSRGIDWKNVTEVVVGKYFDNSCVVVVSDDFEFRFRTTSSRILVYDENFCFQNTIFELLVFAFDQNCDQYVVKVKDPGCFLRMWSETLFKTLSRHSPKFVFLLENEKGFEIFELKESDVSEEILVAYFDPEDSEWPVSLFTNNFRLNLEALGREGRIFLDRWNQNGFENYANLYPNKISNLQGKIFRVMAFPYLPYTSVDPLDGTEIRLVQEYCSLHNCTIEIVDDGNLWGDIYDNGTAVGSAGLVYRREVDVGLGGNYLWSKYFYFVDYTNTALYSAAAILVPKAKPMSGWMIPFLPFSLQMWSVIIFTVLISSFIIYTFNILSIKYTRFRKALLRKHQFMSYGDSFLRILGVSVLQQPSSSLIPNSPTRYLFTSFEFCFLIITVCYSAGLSSILTVPQFTKPIDTFHEFALSNMKWLGNHEAFIYSIKDVDDAEVQKVVKNFRLQTGEELYKSALSGKYAVCLERLAGGHFTEQEHVTEEVVSNSHLMVENLFGSPITFFLQKGSPYLKSFNRLIDTMVESGIYLFWEGEVARRFLSSRRQIALNIAKSAHVKEKGPKKLSLNHIQGSFIILAVGNIFSFIFFILELISSNITNKTRFKSK